jgi:hypothetical protein
MFARGSPEEMTKKEIQGKNPLKKLGGMMWRSTSQEGGKPVEKRGGKLDTIDQICFSS